MRPTHACDSRACGDLHRDPDHAPDEIWHPLGGELDSRAPSLFSDDQGETRQRETRQRGDGEPGRPGTDTGERFDLSGAAGMIRSALRPGV
jgi:hypothetical protein